MTQPLCIGIGAFNKSLSAMYSQTLLGYAIGDRLKPDVAVIFADDMVHITYALWEVSLPLDWVRRYPVIEQLLSRHISPREALANPIAEPLVVLLGAQGCFAPELKDSYTLREIKALFDPMRSQWYSEYYAHPAWQRLRSGQASRNGLLAWLIHNYHVSRAAGVVAARMAAIGGNTPWASFFRQDALDEYWHCDAYYSLDTPLLKCVSAEEIKGYVPLPASLAFEEHTLQVAETDPIAHLLIAYFQESSIAFEEDSRIFYYAVEQQYGVQGLFNPWKQHIQIDVDQGHADGLAKLLESDVKVASTTLEKSLRQVWLAYYFLRCGLDDILSQDNGNQIALRMPARAPCSVSNLWDLLIVHLEDAAIPRLLTDSELAQLHHGITNSAFRALSFSRQHDEVITCGRWAQKLSRTQPNLASIPEANPWCMAIINHLQEAACKPTTWLLLVSLLAERAPGLRLSGEWGAGLLRLLSGADLASDSATKLSQMDELLSRYMICSDKVPSNLL